MGPHLPSWGTADVLDVDPEAKQLISKDGGVGWRSETGTKVYLAVFSCTALYYSALHCTALYFTALHYTALHSSALYCTVLHLHARATSVLETSPSVKSWGCMGTGGGAVFRTNWQIMGYYDCYRVDAFTRDLGLQG